MSESEDLESLKVSELQNELKKRGLDTKGRKADLITRLRQAMDNNTEAGEPTTGHPDESDEDSAPPAIKDDTSSPSSAIEDDDEEEDDEQEQQPLPETVQSENPLVEQIDATLTKKRRLTDEEEEEEKENEEGEETKVEKIQDEDIENNNNENDELSKQRRKKKSRWGSEQDEEESPEKPITTKRTSDDDDTVDNSSTTSSSRQRERDQHRSSRHDDDRHHSSRRSERSPEKEIPLPEEEIVQFNPEDVVLDFYTSDLNLTMNTDCLSASNKSNDALCFLWAGTRATYGFKQGKICYEIRITELIDCPHMPESEKEKFGIRVGWSNLHSGLHTLQLGEFNDSFAYTNAGKKMSKSNDELSEDTYGESFGLSDTIGCYIDFGSNDNNDENMIRISFTKNGQDCGQAFEFDQRKFTKNNTEDDNCFVFYPHILVKNVKFECNFGQLENSWSEMKNDYIFSQRIPSNERIRSSEPIVEKSDCQVIFLSGLNGSGKTTWAKKYMEDNPTKHFNLINVEYVLRQMAVDGKLPTIKDRNDGLMLRVNICLQKLIEIAAQRRRNYIVDHVNMSRETQSKRQRLFTGYHRIGVVVIPDDDELRARIEKVEKSENISIPSQWIREAKAKFHFLQKGSSLEDVIYPELSYEDAKTLYDKARRDHDQHRSSSSRSERHDDHRSSRNDRSRHDDRDHGSRDRDRHNRSRSRDRGSRDRDRDRDRDRRSSREESRHSSSRRNDNYGGGGGGGGGGHSNNYRGGGYSRGGGDGGGGGYSDHRQDSRNNNYNQRGGFQEGGYQGRGGSNYNNNQSGDGWRGGFNQQQRNDYGGGGGGGAGSGSNRGRGDFRGGNQFNNRGSFHDNQRSGGSGGGGGFRSDFNNQQRGRQFNDYDNNSQRQGSTGSGFMPNTNNNNNNNSFNQQHDRQGFGNRPSMQQPQQAPFPSQQQQQQRPQPLLQNPPSNQPPQQQQFPSQQATIHNPAANLSLQTQNPLGINPTGVQQANTLDSWFALYAAALNPQVAQQQQPQQQQIQPQQDANSITQQWTQWLKTAQMGQAAQQQAQPQLTVQHSDSQQQQQLPDATALYYQAYYAQLAAAQQQAAAAAAAAASSGSTNGAIAPPGSNDKSLS